MSKKRILCLILTVVIALGCTMSMSSCMSVMDLYLNSDKTQSGNGGDDGSEGDGNSISILPPSTTEPPVYYPSAGAENVTQDNFTGAARALLSIVSVYASFDIEYGYPSYSTEQTTSRGAGVIYKLDRVAGDAFVITNYHVVYHSSANTSDKISTNIRLFLYGQEADRYAITATYVGGSMANDIAVLRVEDSDVLKNSSALPARVADSDTVNVLDPVLAIGNPEGLGISATNGIISVDSEALPMVGADGKTSIQPRVMRVSAAVNDGNSGGGLFDAEGNLIGIVNAKRNGMYTDNMAYAIPSNVATRLADNIILYCSATDKAARKAMLGIVLTADVMGVIADPEGGTVTRVEMVKVNEVLDSCVIADKIAVGDVINSISVDEYTKDATRVHHVVDSMLLARVGSVVTINVTRGEQTFDITVTVTGEMFSAV